MAGLFAAIGAYFYRKRSFFIGWLIVSYGVGAFLGPRLGAMLSQAAGNWQMPFVWFAVAGLVIAAIVLVAVPKGFTESEGPGKKGPADESGLDFMPTTLWNRNTILGGIGCIILGMSLYGYIGLYTTYLRDGLSFSQGDAAAALSFFGLGGFLSFAGGWCGDRYPQHWVIAVAFAVLACVGFSMYNAATTLGTQSFLSFMTGAVGSGFVFVNLLSMLQRSVLPRMVGQASGIFLTTLFGAASIAGYQMGALVGALGWGPAAVVQLTLLPVIGIVAMLLVNPKQLIPVAKKV